MTHCASSPPLIPKRRDCLDVHHCASCRALLAQERQETPAASTLYFTLREGRHPRPQSLPRASESCSYRSSRHGPIHYGQMDSPAGVPGFHANEGDDKPKRNGRGTRRTIFSPSSTGGRRRGGSVGGSQPTSKPPKTAEDAEAGSIWRHSVHAEQAPFLALHAGKRDTRQRSARPRTNRPPATTSASAAA